ncbi:hypothetical protein [uncultured Polaribacter sp.]|uniref:hypothetical protein n=1 Tax=uncultured Polaribacter sp. TaxID=174711 RepID=UPI00261834EA|nr:hypothetical protein [uncultured Polaribacter sp.]
MSNKAKEFLTQLNSNPKYNGFWQDFNQYCNNFEIPDKNYFVESLPLLYKKIKDDGASYYIYQALRKFAIEKPEEAIKVLQIIDVKPTLENLNFIPSILGGLSESKTSYPYKDKILSLIESVAEYKINSGVNAAYQVVIKDKKEELKFLNEVNKILIVVIEKESVQSLGIIARFYNKHLNSIGGAKEIILQLLQKKNIEVQSEVARSLNEEIKFDEEAEYFQKYLKLLTYTESKYKHVYNTITYRLKDTISKNPEIIIEFINEWILNNKGKLKGISVLKEIIDELYSNHPKMVETLFLEWLNSDNQSYKNALHFVISNFDDNISPIGLPKELLKNFDEEDSLYIVFMIVGNVLDRKYASEMLYNILEVNYKNERIRNHIATLFVKYLIINYYSVTEILKEKRKTANKIITSIINQIIDTSENYYKQVSELEIINEFEPSDKRMNYFLKRQNVQMQKLMDDSESKNNSFLNMITNINLKAGKSFFSKHRGVYSQEAEMQNFKSSFEMPRVQSIDEIGQEKTRLMWQNMKRNELPN